MSLHQILRSLPHGLLVVALGWPQQAPGCGPFIAETYLGGGGYGGTTPLRPPVADLSVELQRLARWAREAFPDPDLAPLPLPVEPHGQHRHFHHMGESFDDTLTVEESELREIAKLEDHDVRTWKIARRELFVHVADAFSQAAHKDACVPQAAIADIQAVAFPAAPAEFTGYIEGVRRFALQDMDAARAQWQAVLDLPADQRKHRAVWAAYMTARSHEAQERWTEARTAYRLTRRLVREGHTDPLGLGIASFKREALCAEVAGDEEQAARLRLAWLGCGDEAAVEAVRGSMAGAPAADQTEALAKAATQPVRRVLVTLSLLREDFSGESLGSATITLAQPWLNAIEAHLHDAPLLHAERLAWAAYSNGRFDLARRWLKLADAKEPMTQWLLGKLALLEGRHRDASRHFATAQPSFAKHPDPMTVWLTTSDYDPRAPVKDMQPCQFHADAATARLANAEFVPALRSFMDSGFWCDAAYIAERVLSREELLQFTRLNTNHEGWPKRQSEPDFIASYGFRGLDTSDLRPRLRYLTARRLAREHYFKDAAPLFPPGLREEFAHYTTAWRIGHDAGLPKAERAAALWEAAQIHRRYGLDFFGYEGDPDHAFYGGSYQSNFIAASRTRGREVVETDSPGVFQDYTKWWERWTDQNWLRDVNAKRSQLGLPLMDAIFPPTSTEERWRLQHYGVAPVEKRFHYRYVAADLAWKAAALMPDNNADTADVLHTAGLWLAPRDPKAADRFYQALVNRCTQLPIGQEADRRRWFPPKSE